MTDASSMIIRKVARLFFFIKERVQLQTDSRKEKDNIHAREFLEKNAFVVFRKNDKDQNQENESSTSYERPTPRDDHDEVVTERTRLPGRNSEAEVQLSPYNLVVVRSPKYQYTPKQII